MSTSSMARVSRSPLRHPASAAGHPRRQAVVEPDPPTGQGPQRGVVPDQALAVAQRAAQEGQYLDDGEDADQRAQARAQRGPAHDVARTGQQADGGGGRGQPEQAGQGEAPVGGARLGEDPPQRAAPHEGTRPQAWAGRATTRSNEGSSVGSWAATTMVRPPSHGSMAGAIRGHRGRVERGRGLVEQQNRRRAQQGPGQRHPLALPRAERQAVVAELRWPDPGGGWP